MRTGRKEKSFKSPYDAESQAAMKRLCEKCVRVMFDGQLVTAENWDAVLGADTFISFYVMDRMDEFLDICTVIGGRYIRERDGHKIEYVLLSPPPPIISPNRTESGNEATADRKEKTQHIHGAAPDNSKARQRVPRNA